MNGRDNICKVNNNLCQPISSSSALLISSDEMCWDKLLELCVFVWCNLQEDVEEVKALYLDAKSSARLLQEQPGKYIT